MLKPKKKIDPEKIWRDLTKAGHKIKTREEITKLKLTDEESAKCRYVVIDQNQRLAECTVHQGEVTHGVRLWPIHLWEIKEGKVYQKVEGKWVEWRPSLKQKLRSFDN